jgi:hypothetical protein
MGCYELDSSGWGHGPLVSFVSMGMNLCVSWNSWDIISRRVSISASRLIQLNGFLYLWWFYCPCFRCVSLSNVTCFLFLPFIARDHAWNPRLIKVPAFNYPMRKLHDFFFKFKRRRLGSVLYAIIKTRDGRFRENPFSGADMVVSP